MISYSSSGYKMYFSCGTMFLNKIFLRGTTCKTHKSLTTIPDEMKFSLFLSFLGIAR